MKLHNIFFRTLATLAVALLAFACQDEIVKIDELRGESNANRTSTAAPTIVGVYDYSTFMNSNTPTPCIEAQMGQDLIVSGENLEGITSLTFFGIEISTEAYYAEWDMIVMRVPYELPAEDATNALICTNSFGSAESSLELAIPNIVISNITNEFALPGSKTFVNGEFLTLCKFERGDSKIYIENSETGYKKEVEINIVTTFSATITIPADAPDNSLFTFEIQGKPLTQKFHYRPTAKLLTPDVDSEMVVAAAASLATIVTDTVEEDIEDIFGTTPVKYLRVKGNIGAGTTLSVFYVTDTFTLEDGTEPSDYALVYELNTKSGCAIPTGNTYKFMVNNKGVNMWENYSKSEVATEGQWVTQRIDFAAVKANLTAVGDKHKFNVKAIGAMPKADHSFANFRIERIIK